MGSSFHTLQKPFQIKLLLILLIVPQLPNLIQPPPLPLLPHLARRINHILFSPPISHTSIQGRFVDALGSLAEIEEVEDLVCFHGTETGVLLVDDCGCYVDFETLESEINSLVGVYFGGVEWEHTT